MTADEILTNWRRSLASYQEAVYAFKHAQQMMQRRSLAQRPRSAVIAQAATGQTVTAQAATEPSAATAPPEATLAIDGIEHVEKLSVGRLTKREREIAALISRGLTNSQIAETLIIEKGTVANHVAHILNKLSLTNRTQVATLVLRWPVSPEALAPEQTRVWLQQSA